MYDAKRDRIEALRQRFDEEIATRSPRARAVADEYLEALTDFVNSYNDGPAADPTLAGVDTTGQLARVEEHAAWAEQERRRVRHAMQQIA
jgi:hypothetical protein